MPFQREFEEDKHTFKLPYKNLLCFVILKPKVKTLSIAIRYFKMQTKYKLNAPLKTLLQCCLNPWIGDKL